MTLHIPFVRAFADRRIAFIDVRASDLLSLLMDLTEERHYIVKGIPEDAHIVSVSVREDNRGAAMTTIRLVLESTTFEPVPETYGPPSLDVDVSFRVGVE